MLQHRPRRTHPEPLSRRTRALCILSALEWEHKRRTEKNRTIAYEIRTPVGARVPRPAEPRGWQARRTFVCSSSRICTCHRSSASAKQVFAECSSLPPRSSLCSRSAVVFPEGHVQRPVQFVLDRPVFPLDAQKILRRLDFSARLATFFRPWDGGKEPSLRRWFQAKKRRSGCRDFTETLWRFQWTKLVDRTGLEPVTL